MGVGGWQLGSDRDPFPRDTQAKARGELNPRGTHGEHRRGAEVLEVQICWKCKLVCSRVPGRSSPRGVVERDVPVSMPQLLGPSATLWTFSPIQPC